MNIRIFIVILRYIDLKMGLTKTENYAKQQLELAQLLKVLGHPARLAILQSIDRTNACICGELVTETGLAQSTVSQHLKELKAVGLIKGTVDGTSMCYCIDKKRWQMLLDHLGVFLNQSECGDNCC